jgi:hypothetical protein
VSGNPQSSQISEEIIPDLRPGLISPRSPNRKGAKGRCRHGERRERNSTDLSDVHLTLLAARPTPRRRNVAQWNVLLAASAIADGRKNVEG